MVKKLVKSKKTWLTVVALGLFSAAAVLFVSKPTVDEAMLDLIVEEPQEQKSVVSRTQIELKTKPTEIKVIAEKPAEVSSEEQTADNGAEEKETSEKQTEGSTTAQASTETAQVQTQVKELVGVMAASLEEGSQQIRVLSDAMHSLNKRVLAHKQQIESLKAEAKPDFGKIKDLTKVFLSQQLVVLDNRFQIGAVSAEEIAFIENFARTTAQMPEVADKLKMLKELLPKEGSVTFAEVQLIAGEAARLHPPRKQVADTAPNYAEYVTFTDKAKAFFVHIKQNIKGLVSVRKSVGEETAHPWLKAIYEARYAIARGKTQEALHILQAAPLGADTRLNDLRALITLYSQQTKALADVQQSFILGYKP